MAFGIASKPVFDSKGEVMLLIVGVRVSNYQSERAGNMEVGRSGDHEERKNLTFELMVGFYQDGRSAQKDDPASEVVFAPTLASTSIPSTQAITPLVRGECACLTIGKGHVLARESPLTGPVC